MKRLSVRRSAASFQHAIDGVLDAYRSQRHMRVHFVFMAANAILALVYKLNALEVALVTIATCLVVSMEMFNTVIEAVINMVCETYHPVARFAKDVAAGAVLVAAVNAIIVALCVYGTPARMGSLRAIWVSGDYVDDSAMFRALVMSFCLLTALLALFKVGTREGSLLRGGVVSGHTAYAFYAATCVFLLVRGTAYAVVAGLLATGVALLVAQLRLADRGLRIRALIYGAALGGLVPWLVFELLARPMSPG